MIQKDCRTCQHDVPYEERTPGAALCQHPEVNEPGFWDRDTSECYQERTP